MVNPEVQRKVLAANGDRGIVRLLGRTACVAAFAFAMSGCAPSSADAGQSASAPADAVTSRTGKTHTISIVGYNYTNRYIDQIYVDGQGGGNLDVSTPTAGGGKTVCCMVWREGTPLPLKLRVKWVSGGCRTLSPPNQFGERFPSIQHMFKEQDVVFKGPVPPNPSYLEIHVYPDEHIEIAITESTSAPRLQLDESRAVDAYPNRCEFKP